MKILSKKIKQRLLVQLFESIIGITPQLLKLIVMSTIGICINLNHVWIVLVLIVTNGNIHVTVNVNDSKKAN